MRHQHTRLGKRKTRRISEQGKGTYSYSPGTEQFIVGVTHTDAADGVWRHDALIMAPDEAAETVARMTLDLSVRHPKVLAGALERHGVKKVQ